MNKKGWYEIRSNNGSFDICIFSIDYRINESEKDTFYPDINMDFTELNDGEWFINKMSISTPVIDEFNDLAIEILQRFKGKDPYTLKEVITVLDGILFDKIPTELNA